MAATLKDVRSAELYARAVQVLPGGVNSPVRAMRSIGRDPLFVASAAGAELTDVDGNTYIDYVCSWGPLSTATPTRGSSRRSPTRRPHGTTFGAPTAGEVELAEEVARRMPSVEMLRMTSSGTEASMSAIRLARAATGRETLLKFAGAYHGHVDGLLAEAGSGLATAGIPAVARRARGGDRRHGRSSPWNDRDAVVAATEEREFAAILAEPYPANMGLVPPEPGFLELLRERADAQRRAAGLRRGHLRLPRRVAAARRSLSGVLPDLTVMGKVIGGGLPAAAYGGPRALMERIAPAGDVYQAGTLSGQPAGGRRRAARRSSCSTTTPTRGWRRPPRRWPPGCADAAGDRPVQVQSACGLVTIFFSDDARIATTWARRAATPRPTARWCRALLAERRVPAAVAVRGVVPVAGAHRRARRAHARWRRRRRPRRGERGARLMSAEGDCWPRRWPRVPTVGPARGPRAGRRRGARARYEAIHERRPAALGAGGRARIAISRCSPATGATRSASRRSRASATCPPRGASPTPSRSCAQAHADGDPDLADAVWVAAATAIGWGESPDLVGAKQRARAGDRAAADHLRDAADSIRRPSPHG